MNATLKPYPGYKIFSEPWINEVPVHWQVTRMKSLLRERVQKGFPDEPLLAATQTKGVVRKDQYENRTVTAMKDLHLLKLVCVGDFVISLRSFQGGIEYARERGIISPAYTVLFPLQDAHHGYLSWLLKSKPYVDNLSLFVTGIREGQNIDYEKLSRSILPLPPLDEQAAIVRYFNHMDRRIRKLIHAKQKLIKLLEEEKQAIIHRAVTRGLDPNVKLKPSGVEWLGEIPEGWEVKRVKFAAHKISKGDTPSNFGREFAENGPVRFIKIENIGDGELVETPLTTIDMQSHMHLKRSQLQENDIVFAISGATTGKSALIHARQLPANTNQAVAFIRPNRRAVPRFLVQWLHSPLLKEVMWLATVQSAQPNLSMEELGNLPLLLPPLHEQNKIVEAIQNRLKLLNEATKRTLNEMALIREYWTRLVADAVTGKVDVRVLAAGLPQETEDETDSEIEEPAQGADDEVSDQVGGHEE